MDEMSPDDVRLPSRRELMLEHLGLGIIPTMLLAPAVALADAAPLLRAGVIRQEVDFKVSPARVYETLMSDREFRAFSGAEAKIQGDPGGAFTLFDSRVVGFNIQLTRNQQIVQAWRAEHWARGLYSIARFDFTAHESGARVLLEQVGVPPDERAEQEAGWVRYYWGPLQKYFKSRF
jgi:activator of HSP90 ATPase